MDKDRRLSVRMLEEGCRIPKTMVHRILIDDFQIKKVYVKMISKVLMSEMKEQRLLKCQAFQE